MYKKKTTVKQKNIRISKKTKSQIPKNGFSRFTLILAILTVIVMTATMGITYKYVQKQSKQQLISSTSKKNSASPKPSNQNSQQQAQATPTAIPSNWVEYKDVGKPSISTGLSIKLPPEWAIYAGKEKIFGNEGPIMQMRTIFYNRDVSPKEEWAKCGDEYSYDACGLGPKETILEDKEFSINGYEAYSAMVKTEPTGPQYTYRVTVIKNKKANDNKIPIVELFEPGEKVRSTYDQIMQTATFIYP